MYSIWIITIVVYECGLIFDNVTSGMFLTSAAKTEFVSLAEMEDALLKNLFQGYQRWVRPIVRPNDTVKVRFGLKISQLVDVVRANSHVLLIILLCKFNS